ncbi:MAG: hypothetical protein CVV52_12165 [Spirochaetae bacterium HGW-Spirochaetae-8]|nr:MAG: hypothetical protein CVV52_12165 [Spirochaetae bacterium HGW-Spirochaetae-8]
MAEIWQEIRQATPPPLGDRLLRRAAAIARRMHAPGWLFDYSKSLLMLVPLLTTKTGACLGYHVRPANLQDLPALALCRQMQNPATGAALFSQRLAQGARCYVVVDSATQLLGYAWVLRTGNLFEDDDRLRITCRPNGAYIFDTFLHPDARGKGLYAHLIAGAQLDMAGQGSTEFHVLVDRGNTVSIKAHLKLGAQVCEICTYSTFLGISKYNLRTVDQRKSCLRRYHTHHPCDSLLLHPLDPHHYILSIARLEDEAALQLACERLLQCEGRNCATNTPFNTGDIVTLWWKSDIQGHEPLFLLEFLHPQAEHGKQTVAFGFFRLHEDLGRFLHPRELIAFDDVQFMSSTVLVRDAELQAIDIQQILNLPKNLRHVRQATGADVVIWHRLPPGELSLSPQSPVSRWCMKFETQYPLLDASAACSPLESPAGIHAMHDLAKQAKRLRNAYQSNPETVCIALGSLDDVQKQLALTDFVNLLQTSWQHDWMEKSDLVDYGKFLTKLLAYTEIWSKHDCVRLYITRVGGIAMAYLYTLQLGQSCWCVLTGYNPLLKSYSPGKTVFIDMLRQSWESGIREYHLGGNVLGWKEAWATRCLNLYTLELWLDTSKALAHRLKLLFRHQAR